MIGKDLTDGGYCLQRERKANKKEGKRSIESCGWKSWLRHYIALLR